MSLMRTHIMRSGTQKHPVWVKRKRLSCGRKYQSTGYWYEVETKTYAETNVVDMQYEGKSKG